MTIQETARRMAPEFLTDDQGEGTLTTMIEEQTARLPSAFWLTLGIGAMVGSLLMLMGGRRNLANFVGQWVPTLLILGLYNKLVKLEGHE
jgi:hypothetical protein